ncbi:MAG TPA: hypothetical protein VGP11_04450 [Acidimicrobiales bacterium]|nr:hypothetical protein [Acidimicrobiales bacterium]
MSARTVGRSLVSGALVCGAALTLLASTAQVSSAASPNDYLCVVGSATQSTTESTLFADPLEVEISTTSCSSPTPDTSTNSVTFALVGTPSASASFDTSAITTSSGFASVSATANSVAGSYSVIATSSATASSSSPSVTFSLTNSTLQSDTLTPDVSSYQSTNIGAAFALPLAVTVDDGSGNPVASLPVTFYAPSSGASGTFAGGSTSVVEETDAEGVAISPAFYANDTPGGYVVDATLSGYFSPIAFAMVNEATTTMTVSSVTPTVLTQGNDQVVTISGSGFESGATVAFASPGIKVTSTTYVSADALSAKIVVSSSARVGASDVVVTNPAGTSATGEDVFTVAPFVSGTLQPLAVGFSRNAATLSGPEEKALRAFANGLSSATLVHCVGYGATAKLADARTLLVARYLRSVNPNARLAQRGVVSASANKVQLT